MYTTRQSTRALLGRNFDRSVTKSAPPQALKLIALGTLTFDNNVVLHRAVHQRQALCTYT